MPIQGPVSARKVIDAIISPGAQKVVKEIVLQIQREMVDKEKSIPETQAGKELRVRFTLQEVLDMQKKLGDKDLRVRNQEADEKVNILVGQIQPLMISLCAQKTVKFAVTSENTTECTLNLVNLIVSPIAQSEKQDILILCVISFFFSLMSRRLIFDF